MHNLNQDIKKFLITEATISKSEARALIAFKWTSYFRGFVGYDAYDIEQFKALYKFDIQKFSRANISSLDILNIAYGNGWSYNGAGKLEYKGKDVTGSFGTFNQLLGAIVTHAGLKPPGEYKKQMELQAKWTRDSVKIK